VNVAPLEQMTSAVMGRATTFFTPTTAYEYSQANTQNFTANKYFLAPNPPYGAELAYRVSSGTARDSAKIIVTDIRGDTVRTLTGPGGPGLHQAYWDLRGFPRPLGPAALRDSIIAARVRRQREDSVRAARGADTTAGGAHGVAVAGGRRGQGGAVPGEINLRPAEAPIGERAAPGGGGGGGFGGARAGNLVEPGDYMVTIIAGGQTMRQVVHVERVGEIVNADARPQDEEGEDPNDP
jgi:hypothetical protein